MNFKECVVNPNISVKSAIEAVQKSGRKVIFILDKNGTLLGIFSDGDMRKYILSGGILDAPISSAMNSNPILFFSQSEVKEYMKHHLMVVYPIVDKDRHLIDAVFWNDDGIAHPMEQLLAKVPVVIMAGGKGTRLYPYTKILPKPLIPIGDLTISEHIIHSFLKFGANDFRFILNHKKNMIKAYFNDLPKNYMVEYLEEETFLGTGGGLSLLKGQIKSTFIVSNCDILLDVDYSDIYKFHKSKGNIITFVCALKNFTIPYGVIHTNEKGQISGFTEKPCHSFLTNTGVYFIEPSLLDDIEANTYYDLPDIAKTYLDKGSPIGVYPIPEKAWMDMGQFQEMEHMLQELS